MFTLFGEWVRDIEVVVVKVEQLHGGVQREVRLVDFLGYGVDGNLVAIGDACVSLCAVMLKSGC